MNYLDLFATLTRHHVAYVLIGGLAVSLHGIERATMDVDVVIAMDPQNVSALIEAANELGLTPQLPVPIESLKDSTLLQEWHTERNLEAFSLRSRETAGVTLDILLFPPVPFGDMQPRAEILTIDGIPVSLAAIEDLIALKQASDRPIDRLDIEHLKRIQDL
jgi:hypothetical protein